MTDNSFQGQCKAARRKGNNCQLSGWICKGRWETQTLKITNERGTKTKWQSRTPCRRRGQKSRSTPAKCMDVVSRRHCEYFASRGFCTKRYVPWMRKNCCRTCRREKATNLRVVDGKWSQWSQWSACTKLCGGGTRLATRRCNKPSNGGRKCIGTGKKSSSCNIESCVKGETKTKSKSESNSCLKSANLYRMKHMNTPPLQWDENLAAKAKAYANVLMNNALRNNGKVTLIHDPKNNDSPGMGENLWYIDSSEISTETDYCAAADKSWYSEIQYWDYKTAKSTGKATGHFTQMVWVATTRVGYGVAVFNSPKFSGNKIAIVVAKYQKRGNINWRGRRFQDYSENVQPVKRTWALKYSSK